MSIQRVEGIEPTGLPDAETDYLDALQLIQSAVEAMARLRTKLTGSGAEAARSISIAITQVEGGELWLKKGWAQK